jgi:hypothetical protein
MQLIEHGGHLLVPGMSLSLSRTQLGELGEAR